MLPGHRYYDASLGRFLSSDPAQAGSNWYAYCDNNPLVRLDPTGHTWIGAIYSGLFARLMYDVLSPTAKSWGDWIRDHYGAPGDRGNHNGGSGSDEGGPTTDGPDSGGDGPGPGDVNPGSGGDLGGGTGAADVGGAIAEGGEIVEAAEVVGAIVLL